jgi:hypothetical protein
VSGYYAFCAAFGGLALALESRWQKLVALGVLGLAALLLLIWASKQPEGKYRH